MDNVNKKIFLSYTTVSQMSEPVYAALKTFLDDFYNIGPPEVLYKYEPYVQKLAVEAAKLLNCDVDEITVTKNTTEGIIIASEAMPLSPGDEILVQANEYPANLLPWLKKKKDGIEVRVIDGPTNKEAYQNLIKSIGPKTKAVAISAGQYYDGFMANLEELSAICCNKGIYIALDAVQIVGVRNLDLTKTPVDFLFCGGQKYLRAGTGTGFLYVNKQVLPKLRDTKVGIRSMKSFDQSSYVLKDTAERFLDGTLNLNGIVALYTALKEVNNEGIEKIAQKNLSLLKQIKDLLNKYKIPYIDNGDQQSNIVSMYVGDPLALYNYFIDKSIYIRATRDVARISFIHETKIEDIETVIKLIREWIDSQSGK